MDFVDTKILLYAVGRDRPSAHKRQIARALLPSADLAISVQVLSEFYTDAIRPEKAALSDREAELHCEAWCSTYRVADLTSRTFHRALRNREQFPLSYWDALILASAQELRCERLITEDLNHGQDYAGVVAHDPFLNA